MLRERLLLLYPRAWRERYGEEFLATLGAEPLRPSQVLDIVRGAIDARVSGDVRQTMPASAGASGSGQVCVRPRVGVTPRDGLIGAGVMIGVSLLMRLSINAAVHAGLYGVASVLSDNAFLAPFTLSMPFWLMKGTSWWAQTTIVAVTLVLLIALSYGR
jgi:hypothetical protein